MDSLPKDLAAVRSFWDTEACGTHFIVGVSSEAEFFERYRRFRRATEWHITELVPFAEFRRQRVLEIGCGNGADGVLFAEQGAQYTGVDVTGAAVEATRRHFACLKLAGQFQVENAEALSFSADQFDAVYSHGALHHTPHPALAIREVHRVLKPGGRAIIMLYHRHSFNYYIRILGYMRLRVLLHILGRLGRWAADRAALSAAALSGVRGNADTRVWQLHYRNFLRDGWAYLRAGNFVHHATDGPECPVAFAYSRAEARQLFAEFPRVEFRVVHFPLRKYRWGRWVPLRVERWLAGRLGWYLFIFATKGVNHVRDLGLDPRATA